MRLVLWKLNQVVKKSVKTGDVGYLITGIKTAKEVKGWRYHYRRSKPYNRDYRRF